MNPYRGKLLATAVLFAALPLFGCGDADKWEQTTEITLSAPEPEGLNEVVFTVVSPPPAEGYACETLLEYRAQGAGVDIDWRTIPGTETTRLFEVRPRAEGIMSVMARGMCEGSKEDWKYSNRVDVTVTEAALPTVSAVTLTANPTSVVKNNPVTFNLNATKLTGCTLRLKYQASGAGISGILTVDPASTGAFQLTPPAAGTLSVTATGWCAENPTAQVTTTTNVTVTEVVVVEETITTPSTPTGLGTLPASPAASNYTTSESFSNLGPSHVIQYNFDWGDGSAPDWGTTLSRSHTWMANGTYSVTVQARCQTHGTVLSAISGTKTVTVGP